MVINFIFSRICQSNILAGYLASGEVRSMAKRSMAILLVTTCPSSRGTRFVLRNLLSPSPPPLPPSLLLPAAGVAWKASANVPPMTIKICRQHI